ncbi:MAG: glycosyltransferase family 4 protein [Deltaproteobacteria bacterium]|nr:glycosyltransferase family 4 protein [Deltaproteobacteria bacterium]
MPRVLLTGFAAVPGPRRAGVQLRHVIRSLTPLHTVDLLVVREGEQAYVERQGSVRVLRVPSHEADLRSQIQAFQRALKRQLDGADYDVVHCRDSWSGIPVLEARARLGYAVVYDLTRSPLGETTFDAELDAQYGRDEEACLLAADLVLAPTPAAVKALQGRGKPERVMLSPPGVDIDRFDWDDLPRSGPPRILYVGSIDPGRGVRVLVRAMANIVREVDARLVLAGSMAPKFDQALKDGIHELGLDDKVDVLGPVDHDQLPTLLATATVCVVPAAADLTPNPTVLYPTKLLEYMACRCAIVAPRRETVAQVVENNREALLFEPGDPIDLARKVLRLISEPILRENLAQNAYQRVRRDFTASAARRALRKAYNVLAERFAEQLGEDDDEGPRVEVLADDDFEATVFEEAPAADKVDTAVSSILPLEDDGSGHTSSESVAAPPGPREVDETMERKPVKPGPRDAATAGWAVSTVSPVVQAGQDDWVVTNVAAAVRSLDAVLDEAEAEAEAEAEGGSGRDEGTPVEGVIAVAPALPLVEGTFVAGEIDVPTPPPEREGTPTPSVDFTAASSLLGQPEPVEPDTGSRTPPIERR